MENLEKKTGGREELALSVNTALAEIRKSHGEETAQQIWFLLQGHENAVKILAERFPDVAGENFSAWVEIKKFQSEMPGNFSLWTSQELLELFGAGGEIRPAA